MTAPLPPDHTPSGASTGRGNAAAPSEIQVMFDRIAPRYDLLNLLISAFQEPRWRRRLVMHAGLRPGGAALDVASGTGKVAADLHRLVQPGGRVLGVDLSPGMVAVARQRSPGRPQRGSPSRPASRTRWRRIAAVGSGHCSAPRSAGASASSPR